MKIYTAIIFSILFIFSQFSSPQDGEREVFPFFNWSLFSVGSSFQSKYYIHAPSLQCEGIKCPSADINYWDYEKLMRDMGKAYEEKNHSAFESSKQKIDHFLFSKNQVQDYELRRRHYSAIDYVKNGEVKEDIFLLDLKVIRK